MTDRRGFCAAIAGAIALLVGCSPGVGASSSTQTVPRSSPSASAAPSVSPHPGPPSGTPTQTAATTADRVTPQGPAPVPVTQWPPEVIPGAIKDARAVLISAGEVEFQLPGGCIEQTAGSWQCGADGRITVLTEAPSGSAAEVAEAFGSTRQVVLPLSGADAVIGDLSAVAEQHWLVVVVSSGQQTTIDYRNDPQIWPMSQFTQSIGSIRVVGAGS